MRRCSLCQLVLEVEAPAHSRNSSCPHSSNSRSSSVRLKLANYDHLLLVVAALLPLVVEAFRLLVVVAFRLVAFRRLVVALLLLLAAVGMNHHQTWDAPAEKGLDLEHPSLEAAQPKLRLEDSALEACPRSGSQLPLVSVAAQKILAEVVPRLSPSLDLAASWHFHQVAM